MSLKRKPEAIDGAVLLYCGILGHRFVTTILAADGERKSCYESNHIPTIRDLREYGWDEQAPRTFERVNRCWRRIR